MSNKKVLGAKLAGFSGPYFPESLARIQKRFAYHPERLNDMLYDRVSEALAGGRVKHFPVTSDVTSRVRSPWPIGIQFLCREKQWKILFPNALDSEKSDGTFASRHVALYCRGEPTEAEILAAADLIAQVFVTTYTDKYRRAISQSKAEKD